ncbi:hypothetical protein FBU30_008295 [Linnemannia zychae]|nr:hypothetical protein FBU30_008295 [Linnemannia zychae]
MGQNQSTAAEEPYHKRHYIETNRQVQRQNSISLTSPTLLQPGNNALREYALKRAGTMGGQSSSTVNLQSGGLSTATSITGRSGVGSGVAGDIGNANGADAPKPFIRLLPIEVPQPVYFDESSASEQDDYDYEDEEGEYSDGNSDVFDHSRSRYSSNHFERRHPHHNNKEYNDDNGHDIVDHVYDRNINSRGLASSPSFAEGEIALHVNTRTTTMNEHRKYSREQADYRRSKEEEEEDFSYLSPVSGIRRFSRPNNPHGGLLTGTHYFPPSYDDDESHPQDPTYLTDSDDGEDFNEELHIKRYQLRDLPNSCANDKVTDAIIADLEVKSLSSSTKVADQFDSTRNNPNSSSLQLDAIHEEKEDNEDSGIPPSSPSALQVTYSSKGTLSSKGDKERPVSVSSSNNSLKEKSRMGYSLAHAQPLQEANNQHNSNGNFSSGSSDSYTFGAPPGALISCSLQSPLDSVSSYQQHQDQRREHVTSSGSFNSSVNNNSRMSFGNGIQEAVFQQQGEPCFPLATTDTATTTTARLTILPPALAPRPPTRPSDNEILDVLGEEVPENVEYRSNHTRQGSTTLRKEMLSNVSERVSDLDNRVNHMEALVAYQLTDIEAKVQVLHDGQSTLTSVNPITNSTDVTSQQDTLDMAISSQLSNAPLSFAEGYQPALAQLEPSTTNSNRTSQLLDKASLLELRLELQTFGMRFHELNDSLLTDLMTQLRQAKIMLLKSTTIVPGEGKEAAAIAAIGGKKIDPTEVEMHTRLLSEIEKRIQERVLAMEQTSARLEACFDKMEARLGALETVLVAGSNSASSGSPTMLRRPRPESMYKILQQQQQLQRQQQQKIQQQEQELQRLRSLHALHEREEGYGRSRRDSSPESPLPDKHNSPIDNVPASSISSTSTSSATLAAFDSNSISPSNCTLSTQASSFSFTTSQKPPLIGGKYTPQYPRATRPTRILTTSLHNNNGSSTNSTPGVPHLLQQRTAPLSAGVNLSRNHHFERALTFDHLNRSRSNSSSSTSSDFTGSHHSSTIYIANGHVNGPVSAHPLSSSLPPARQHLLQTQRSMSALKAGPLKRSQSKNSGSKPSGRSEATSTREDGGASTTAGRQKPVRRPSSYKELLHFWKAGGSTPDLLNTANISYSSQ